MKRICIVTQSAEFAKSAGMRVRYERFIAASVRPDVEILVQPIGDLLDPAAKLECDVYIFCKTFTAEAIVLAHAMKRAGRTVGQDLFDDYFSQQGDQRLFQYRDWLRQMAAVTDFAICTTRRMEAVLRPFLPDCPIVLVEDPVIGHDPFRIAAMAARKAARAKASGTLRLAWFGIGDNPFFPVGLEDLTASGVVPEIARLADLGWTTSLTIATNMRALDARGLSRLRALPMTLELVEWSEAVEAEVLAGADVALLPVSGQGFSRAKSLNRALTALEQGCQVLRLGYPLYERLDEVIYHDAEELSEDLHQGRPRLRADTVVDLTRMLSTIGDAFAASNKFVSVALDEPQRNDKHAPLVVIHGRDSGIGVHKLNSRFGGLSVRSPYSVAKWNCQIRFDIEHQTMVMRAALAVADRHKLPRVADAKEVRIGDLSFATIDVAALGLAFRPVLTAMTNHPLAGLASYSRIMGEIERACRLAFPGYHVALSDTSQIRGSLPVRAA